MTWRDLSTGQLLIAFLHADDLEGVAGELGRRRDRRVAPQLATIIRMVGMRRWNRPFRIDQTDVGVYAAQILGEIGEYRLLIRLLHERGQLRPQTILRGLHGAPPTVYAHLLPMLPKGYPINRHATIVAGGVRYAPALDGLIPLLRSKRSDTAYEAAKALGLIGDPRAVDALIGRLSLERRAWVYYQVIEALGKLGDRRATQHVVLALDVAHDSRVIYVVRALKRLGDEMAVAPLIATMHRFVDMHFVAKDVVLALAHIGGDRAHAGMMEGMHLLDADRKYRKRTLRALVHVDTLAAREALRAWAQLRRAKWREARRGET